MMHLLEVVVIVVGLIVVTFLVLLSLPQCKLREILTAMATIRASKQKESHLNDPYFN